MDGVHHRDDRGVNQPLVADLADVELDVGSLDLGQGSTSRRSSADALARPDGGRRFASSSSVMMTPCQALVT